MWFYKESYWYKETPVSMWFYKESYWYKWRLQGLRGFTKNHTGTNRDSVIFAVLQRIILVQLEAPLSIWLYKESYWYK